MDKNERETIARVTKELSGQSVPALADATAKVTDYESRLSQVAQFEEVMTKDPEKFLTMLSSIPAYKGFFDQVTALSNGAASADRQSADVTDADPMPQPNQPMADGSAVYDMDGIKNILEWQGRRTKNEVTREFETRYGPIEANYKAQAREADPANN